MNAKPLIVTLSGPTASGKSTLQQRLLNLGWGRTVSTTTRSMRAGEIEGRHYYFIDDAAFKAKFASGDLFEYTHRPPHSYGTTMSEIERVSSNGKPIAMVCDPAGLYACRKNRHRVDHISVFLCPEDKLVYRRFLERFEGDDMASVEDYANRLKILVDEELGWAKKHRDAIDLMLPAFAPETEEFVIAKIIEAVEELRARQTTGWTPRGWKVDVVVTPTSGALHPLDQKIPGTYTIVLQPSLREDQRAAAALDVLHRNIPIKNLEDFEFEVRGPNGVIDDPGTSQPYASESRGYIMGIAPAIPVERKDSMKAVEKDEAVAELVGAARSLGNSLGRKWQSEIKWDQNPPRLVVHCNDPQFRRVKIFDGGICVVGPFMLAGINETWGQDGLAAKSGESLDQITDRIVRIEQMLSTFDVSKSAQVEQALSAMKAHQPEESALEEGPSI